jgi:hypothetical protein
MKPGDEDGDEKERGAERQRMATKDNKPWAKTLFS